MITETAHDVHAVLVAIRGLVAAENMLDETGTAIMKLAEMGMERLEELWDALPDGRATAVLPAHRVAQCSETQCKPETVLERAVAV